MKRTFNLQFGVTIECCKREDIIRYKNFQRPGKPVYCVNCRDYGYVASYKVCPSRIKIVERPRGKSESNTASKKKHYIRKPLSS